MRPTADEVRARMAERFPDAVIEVVDESHLHAGHAGASGGAGHFRVSIRSESFVGRLPLARHRLVYDSVLDWMPNRIHALTIDARTPSEAAARGA